MAHINLNDVYTGESTQQNQVGFFNLRNDGDEAVVRIMVDSVEDLEILTVHDVSIDGRYRQVSCVRDPREPLENCPLCAKGEKVKQVVFIKMLEYVNTPNGVEVRPVVWQRSASTYAFRIKGYLDNYGPLSNVLCKIIRHGAKGDVKTTYDIIPNLNPKQFPQENFPIVSNAFEGYSALGRIVLDKNINEIRTFIDTGSFPNNSSETVDIKPQPQYNATNINSGSVEAVVPPVSDTRVFEETFEPNMQRPTRYY